MSGQYSSDPMLDMFIFETKQNIEQLEQIIIQSEKSNTFSKDAINEIFRIMHTIKGSSAMMSYDNLSSLAHKAEDLFYFIREKQPKAYNTSQISDLILGSIDFVNGEIEKIKNGQPSEAVATELIQKISNVLESLKSGKAIEASPKTAKETQNVSEMGGVNYGEGTNLFKLVFFFEEGCEMENIRAFNLVFTLKDIAHTDRYIPEDIADSDESIELIKKDGFIIFFRTDKSLEEMQKFFDRAVFVKDYDLIQFATVREYEQEKSGKKIQGQAAETEKKQPEEQAAQKESSSAQTQSIISVNVSKLDKLMDAVGELVIAEALVTQNPDLNGLNLLNFNKAARHMQKIINELQDLAMSVRMVPLTNTFQKMNRIVRDMSKKLGKEVQLQIIGDETEVDKNIIDNLSDPLMHLVRNSVDHGIEPQEERTNKGKPAVGTVMLEAKNEGGEVLIFVRDDGKGLNKEKILSRAKASGQLIKPESEMTDREIYSLIFLPGFSTKEDVTEFSGRGVGMDVVVKNIEKLGGRVIVDSIPGKGTQTTIRFPMTLAIINGMNLKVGDSKYTIPITAIKELIKPKESQIIRDPDNNEMMMFRGKCCPIIKLNEFFGVESANKDITQGVFVLAEDGENTVCLYADELIGEHQVVVKPLPVYIRGIKGLSGCTILGDGSLSLIVDMGSLIFSTVDSK